MWPFSNRGPRLDVEEAMLKRKPDFDFTSFERNDESIKLWMPDKIITAIDVLSLSHNVSRPDVLRWILFEHAYGRELFAGLCSHAETLKATDNSGVKFSHIQAQTLRSVNQQFLGKATEDVKLWLPSPLKIVLQGLAEGKGEPLSDYLRSVLVRHLFGEHFYAKWQGALTSINQRAAEHESPIYVKGQQENLIQPAMWD